MKNITELLKTPHRREKEARDLAIYKRYNELKAVPGAMATAACEVVCKEFGVRAPSTVWVICKRVERQIETEKGAKR